jgi:CheY-like chemotaxis protein
VRVYRPPARGSIRRRGGKIQQHRCQTDANGCRDAARWEGESALRRRRAGYEKLTAAAERCARIVKNFLALARQHQPTRSLVHVNSVVGEAVELLAYPLRADGVELTLNLPADLPPIWADPHQLRQVLVNLVTNAHHAMQNAPSPRRLMISTAVDRCRERVILQVADSGPGIPAEIRARIFDPFFTTKPPGQGTGLGLSLCYSIIESHRGSISVEEERCGGARFVIGLPLEARSDPGPVEQPAHPEPVIRGKTILVVDDEVEIADVLGQILGVDGYTVDLAPNGVVALQRLGERSYDLIVSDLRMPEMDGPTLYAEVQRRYPALCTRFVFLTGDALGAAMEFVTQSGAPTLSKPFAATDVRRVVQRAFAGS